MKNMTTVFFFNFTYFFALTETTSITSDRENKWAHTVAWSNWALLREDFLAAFIPYNEVEAKVTPAEQVSQAEPLSL